MSKATIALAILGLASACAQPRNGMAPLPSGGTAPIPRVQQAPLPPISAQPLPPA